MELHCVHIQVRPIPTLNTWALDLIHLLKQLLLSSKLNEFLYFFDKGLTKVPVLIKPLVHPHSTWFHLFVAYQIIVVSVYVFSQQ